MSVWEYKMKTGETAPIHHTPGEIELIKEVVSQFAPYMIIELGTAFAGLTAVFHEAAPWAKIWSFDKVGFMSPVKKKLKECKDIHFIRKDILIDPYAPIVALCKVSQKKILYCDNGNKIVEVEHYGHALSPGDLLGVHDMETEIWPHHIPAAYFRPHEINETFETRKTADKVRFDWKTRFYVRK